jgi:drug/metabolite transporter (DMT)-like permease
VEEDAMKVTGFLFLLGYILMVGGASFLQKLAMKDLSPYQLNFFMFIGMLLTAAPALFLAQRSLSIPTQSLPLGLTIGLLMAIGSLSYVLAISRLPVGVAASVASSYLVVVVALSVVFLHEPLSLPKIAGILLTVVGVAILSVVA